MKIPTRFSKPFAAWVTALTDRYRLNPYYRSAFSIVILQVALTLILVTAFGYALRFQQAETITALTGLKASVFSPEVRQALAQVRNETLQYALISLVLLTSLFGYFTARFALRPTRNSLQFQKRFIGNMAHEIRTPLAIIKTNTEVALMDPDVDPSMRELLNTTTQELDRISETINNLLSFDAMMRPSRQSFSKVNVDEVAAMICARHEALAQSRGIELSYTTDGPAFVFGNLTGIEQVYTNLVKNAINYTPQHSGGSVAVSLQGSGKTVTFSVSDTGIGIAKKDLNYIFQPFFRADTSRVRGVSGGTSGLGLAIVNEIVRAHNGRIFVRSTLNRGTTIEVTFPKARMESRDDKEPGEVSESFERTEITS